MFYLCALASAMAAFGLPPIERGVGRRALLAAAPLAAAAATAPLATAAPLAAAAPPLPPLPQMGLGTCCDDEASAYDAVLDGLGAGYRLIDTAAHYESEAAVGAAVDTAVQRGVVRREDLTIVTKVWFDDMGYEPALAAAMRSLERLRTSQLDVLLVHFPGSPDSVQSPAKNRRLREETWRALEALQADGRARTIGVSNWTRRHLRETLATCRVAPQVLQTEIHPRLQQSELVADAAAAGMRLMAHCPLAHGAPALLNDPTLARVAAAHGRTPAQAALRWSLQRGLLPIPKASSAARRRENLAALGFELTPREMGEIDGLEAADRCSFDPGLIA